MKRILSTQSMATLGAVGRKDSMQELKRGGEGLGQRVRAGAAVFGDGAGRVGWGRGGW